MHEGLLLEQESCVYPKIVIQSFMFFVTIVCSAAIILLMQAFLNQIL